MGEYMINCFANISIKEAYRVTQKLDLDVMSERSTRTLKDKNDKTYFLLQILGLFASYRPFLDDSDDISDIKRHIKCLRTCFLNADVGVYCVLTHLQTVIKITFVANIGFIPSIMSLFEWFWYLWPKMVFKMFQEFPTVSLYIPCQCWQGNHTHDSMFSGCNFFCTFSMGF